MLIGDIIISARELYPDLPGVISSPGVPVLTQLQVAGANVPPGTWYIKLTLSNLWGETSPSTEASITVVAPNNAINVSWGLIGGTLIQTGVNAYIGASAGQESVKFSSTDNTGNFNITTIGQVQSVVPTRSTAFLPDTNGRMISVGTVYRWLNEALNVASYICKGIPDTSGLQMKSGQGMYVMPGIWDKFENCWYDGYPVAFDARSGAFYRNVLSGITFIGILQTSSDRQIMEFQPQPSRSGGTTTLSAGIGISDRGLGGTQQQAWPIGTVVNELNFRFGGLRLNQQVQYQPGQSLLTLQIPPGWAPALVDYLVGRFREAEQNFQAKGESIKSFTSFLKDYNRGTKQVAGPRQLGGSTPAGDGYPSASSGGRLIIP